MMARDPELYRRINENLRKVYNGTYKRQAALERANERRRKENEKQYRRELAADRKESKQRIAAWRHEINILQRQFKWLYDGHDKGTLNRDLSKGMDEYAWLEEVDARINTLSEQIVREERLLYDLEWMLR